MTIDIAKQIGAISRQVEQQQSEAGEIVTVTMERRGSKPAAKFLTPLRRLPPS
jgi:hypothetical protein